MWGESYIKKLEKSKRERKKRKKETDIYIYRERVRVSEREQKWKWEREEEEEEEIDWHEFGIKICFSNLTVKRNSQFLINDKWIKGRAKQWF